MLNMSKEEKISSVQKKIRIKHSANNIRRSLILMRRAVTALTFSSESLEGTGSTEMMEEINGSKISLADAIRKLSKYDEEEEEI